MDQKPNNSQKKVVPKNKEALFDGDIDKEIDEIYHMKSESKPLIEKEEKFAHQFGINAKTLNVVLIIFIVFCSIFIFFAYASFSTKMVIVEEEIVELQNMTIEEEGPEIISYGSILSNVDNFEDKKISLRGNIVRYFNRDPRPGISASTGVYVLGVVDDLQNEIELRNVDEFEFFFPEEGKSDELYEVIGIFRRTFQENYLEVELLRRTSREIVVLDTRIEEQLVNYKINKTIEQPRFPLIYNLWSINE